MSHDVKRLSSSSSFATPLLCLPLLLSFCSAGCLLQATVEEKQEFKQRMLTVGQLDNTSKVLRLKQ